MAQPVFLELEGANQGEIKGQPELGITGEADAIEDKIECLTYSDGVDRPMEAGGVAPGGNSIHSPIMITKWVDKSSALLHEAMKNNEELTGTFKFYRASLSGDGGFEHYYTVEIKKARVASMVFVSPEGNEKALESIAISYREITWTYEDGGLTCADTGGS